MRRLARSDGALAVVVVVATGAAGCSADAFNSGSGGEGPCEGGGTVRLLVSPARVVRGDQVTIRVTWTTEYALLAPMVTFSIDAIEVDLELESAGMDGQGYAAHQADMLNPFGFGAPAGVVNALAGSRDARCLFETTATTNFRLD